MGWFSKKKRYGVTNVFVALDQAAFSRVLDVCARAEDEIAAGGEDFAIASAAVAKVAGFLLDATDHATHAAVFGEQFRDEGEAGAFGQECFTELSTRYLSGPDGGEATRALPGEKRAVVMLTVAYAGERPALEEPPGSVLALQAALRDILALHHANGLLLAHIHHAPAHPDDKLTDEQLLVHYPELLSL
jgi:Protein of unknown function (DUF1517)